MARLVTGPGPQTLETRSTRPIPSRSNGVPQLPPSAAAPPHPLCLFQGAFANRFANGTLHRRRSPTCVYPLLAGAAGAPQAEALAQRWLLNASRFCLNPQWPRGNTDVCYWGLPSISADDAAYLVHDHNRRVYWRGNVWGAQVMLTYWALAHRRYRDLPGPAAARKALCRQMLALLRTTWHGERAVCEHYSPKRDVVACEGESDSFHTWGALLGMASLVEEGYY